MDVASIDLASVDHVLSTTRAVRKRLDLQGSLSRRSWSAALRLLRKPRPAYMARPGISSS